MALVVADEGTGLLAGLDRSGNADGNASRGVGLGLALARLLMEAHGGALTVESATGIGTQVVLGFPAGRVMTADSEQGEDFYASPRFKKAIVARS